MLFSVKKMTVASVSLYKQRLVNRTAYILENESFEGAAMLKSRLRYQTAGSFTEFISAELLTELTHL